MDNEWDHIFIEAVLNVSEQTPDANTKVPEIYTVSVLCSM